ncbi:hypothetical protein VTP01DRAFT_7738 [Rhizomucor pusillus]|uniref:uncharacterized protein n=1 Tax=Rhizomucor pusillus TaxID=4840 RepID=UPI003742970D
MVVAGSSSTATLQLVSALHSFQINIQQIRHCIVRDNFRKILKNYEAKIVSSSASVMSVGELKNTWRSRFDVSCTVVKTNLQTKTTFMKSKPLWLADATKHDYIYRDQWKEYGEQGLVFYTDFNLEEHQWVDLYEKIVEAKKVQLSKKRAQLQRRNVTSALYEKQNDAYGEPLDEEIKTISVLWSPLLRLAFRDSRYNLRIKEVEPMFKCSTKEKKNQYEDCKRVAGFKIDMRILLDTAKEECDVGAAELAKDAAIDKILEDEG